MTIARRFVNIAPAILVASTLMYLGALIYARSRPARRMAVAGLPRLGETMPDLIAYSGLGVRVGPAPQGSCALIHYIDAGCEP